MNPLPTRIAPGRRTLQAIAFLVVLLISFSLFVPGSVLAQSTQPVDAQPWAEISPFLENELSAASASVPFLVILDEQADAGPVVDGGMNAASTGETDRILRAETLYRTLTKQALESQAPLRAWLDARGISYRAFYIVNMIEVQGDIALAQELRALPGVDRLAANPLVRGEEPVPDDSVESWHSQGVQSVQAWPYGLYGLPATHAPEVWDLGYTGKGIVVASQDTGVEWDHPALIRNYRGYDPETSGAFHEYNWFDAWDTPPYDGCGPDYQIPCDDNGHGTHTVGTMVGDAANDASSSYTNIGMAPGAQWIACRNMRQDYGTPASYADCFQFMFAPYPQDGDPFTDGRPELAPHIINNSWSCPPTEGCDADSLRQVVETARAAGQFVVASAGNYGPECYTVQYPIGMHDATFTVGAHDSYGGVPAFSSRGPVSADGSYRLKPDLVAPGAYVLSSIRNGGYGWKSGTSMASPHVAGAAALLWSAAPDLVGDVDLTEQVLIKSATPVADGTCQGDLASSPNPTYGYGRLNALAAVTLGRTPWTVTVSVTDEAMNPVSGLLVELTDMRTNFVYSSKTNGAGVAGFQPVLSGDYTLVAGSGGSQSLTSTVALPTTEDPNLGDRQKLLDVVVPIPTALEEDDAPPRSTVYLPALQQ